MNVEMDRDSFTRLQLAIDAVLAAALNAEPPAVPSRESELETALLWATGKMSYPIRYEMEDGPRYACGYCRNSKAKSPENIEHAEDCHFAAAKRLLGEPR